MDADKTVPFFVAAARSDAVFLPLTPWLPTVGLEWTAAATVVDPPPVVALADEPA